MRVPKARNEPDPAAAGYALDCLLYWAGQVKKELAESQKSRAISKQFQDEEIKSLKLALVRAKAKIPSKKKS